MGRGTGLGLASVFGTVKGHGGYIDVDSELGRGTSFYIYLPASEKKVEKLVSASGDIIKGGETILLVEDEDLVLDVGVRLLEMLGYTVIGAGGGSEALKIYTGNREKIDLVILDLIMPDMGGGEVYNRLKEINPGVKVILSSGYSIDGQATEIMKSGCDGFIQKPFNMSQLSAKVREVLDKEKEIGTDLFLLPPPKKKSKK